MLPSPVEMDANPWVVTVTHPCLFPQPRPPHILPPLPCAEYHAACVQHKLQKESPPRLGKPTTDCEDPWESGSHKANLHILPHGNFCIPTTKTWFHPLRTG